MNRQLDKHHDHTRAVLYRITNHVLARAQYAATGRIGRRRARAAIGEWRWLSCQCPRASVPGDGGTHETANHTAIRRQPRVELERSGR